MDLEKLSLGKKKKYIYTYNPKLLEYCEWKKTSETVLINLKCLEFTSLCPKTGQPDFGKVFITYIPQNRIVESKSLKYYLFSFRNHSAFHETCISTIHKDLESLLKPFFLEVYGDFNLRGGIAIRPYAVSSTKEFEDLKKKRTALFLRLNLT